MLNDGRYGHGVFDGAIRVSLAKAAKYPDPTADRGHHEVTLAVLPHGPGLADVRAHAARLNAPVARGRRWRTRATGRARHRDRRRRSTGVEIDAVKLADDGSGDLIVRLHEAVGNRTRVSVATAGRIVEAWRCNLLEEPWSGEEVGDGVVAITMRPFQLVTLRLRCTHRR